MKASEILYGAADHIDAFGHHKGGAVAAGDIRTAPMCVVGAITYARILGGATRDDGWRAQNHLQSFVATPLVMWNDRPERTATEVVEALRATALIAAARETTTETAPERAGVSVA